MDDNGDSIRKAEILSTTGAGVLGAGLGLLPGRWLAPFALALLLAGAAAHVFGMYSKHRLESRAGVRRARWEGPVYWLFWLMLAAIVLYPLVFP